MTKYAIWDIDNCLADDKWRAHLIDWDKRGNERYDRYNSVMLHDEVCHREYFHFMCRFTTPVFFTGRTVKWEGYTREWLQDRLGVRDALLHMRENNDNATPAQVKREMLSKLYSPRSGEVSIVAAFDDIPAVVEMYRSFGIAACLLYINEDLSGTYKPRDLAPISNHA
jgi:hypothetical protein